MTKKCGKLARALHRPRELHLANVKQVAKSFYVGSVKYKMMLKISRSV